MLQACCRGESMFIRLGMVLACGDHHLGLNMALHASKRLKRQLVAKPDVTQASSHSEWPSRGLLSGTSDQDGTQEVCLKRHSTCLGGRSAVRTRLASPGVKTSRTQFFSLLFHTCMLSVMLVKQSSTKLLLFRYLRAPCLLSMPYNMQEMLASDLEQSWTALAADRVPHRRLVVWVYTDSEVCR